MVRRKYTSKNKDLFSNSTSSCLFDDEVYDTLITRNSLQFIEAHIYVDDDAGDPIARAVSQRRVVGCDLGISNLDHAGHARPPRVHIIGIADSA